MTSDLTLFVCHDPQSAKWQLMQPPGTRLLMIAWKESVAPVDSGVPAWAAEVLAKGLTDVFQVTFPSTAVRAADAEHSTQLVVKGVMRRLKSSGPVEFRLITTRRPALVVEAFDDPGFPWWLQAQVLLLSPPDANGPEVESGELLEWIESPGDAALRGSAPFVAELRPGVDGDVAGLITHQNHDE